MKLLLPSEKSNDDSRAILLAHELAHFWFGNLVTTCWWDDVWFQEVLPGWLSQEIYADYSKNKILVSPFEKNAI